MQESADLAAELSQVAVLVVGKISVSTHIYIVSRHKLGLDGERRLDSSVLSQPTLYACLLLAERPQAPR
jgi:hypothetical protein